MCEFLIAAGGCVHATTTGGATPLHRAAYCNHTEVLFHLSLSLFSPPCLSFPSLSPFYSSPFVFFTDLFLYLLQIVKYLNSKGSKIDAQDSDGMTPLHKVRRGEEK